MPRMLGIIGYIYSHIYNKLDTGEYTTDVPRDVDDTVDKSVIVCEKRYLNKNSVVVFLLATDETFMYIF